MKGSSLIVMRGWLALSGTAVLLAPSCQGYAGGDIIPMLAPAPGTVRADSDCHRPHPRTTVGPYTAEARGAYRGVGTINVTTTSLQVSLTVKDDIGNIGTLSAALPLIEGRFNGCGVAMGQQMKLNGRVDASDDATGVLTSARVSGTFTAANGHYGRIAGQYALANVPG